MPVSKTPRSTGPCAANSHTIANPRLVLEGILRGTITNAIVGVVERPKDALCGEAGAFTGEISPRTILLPSWTLYNDSRKICASVKYDALIVFLV
jgi:hypothetical protein